MKNDKTKIVSYLINKNSIESFDFKDKEENNNSLLYLHAFINYELNFVFGLFEIKDFTSLPEKVQNQLSSLLSILSEVVIIINEAGDTFEESKESYEFLKYFSQLNIFDNKKKEELSLIEIDIFSNIIILNNKEIEDILNLSMSIDEDKQMDKYIINHYNTYTDIIDSKFLQIIKNLFKTYDNNYIDEKLDIVYHKLIPILTLYNKEINGNLLFGIIQGYIDNCNYDYGSNISLISLIENGIMSEMKTLKETKLNEFRDNINNKLNDTNNSLSILELIKFLLTEINYNFISFLHDSYQKIEEPMITSIQAYLDEIKDEFVEYITKHLVNFESYAKRKLKDLDENFFYVISEKETTPDIDLCNLTSSISFFFLDLVSSIDENYSYFKNIFEYFSEVIFKRLFDKNSKMISDKIQFYLKNLNSQSNSLKEVIEEKTYEIENLEKNLKFEIENSLDLKYQFEKLQREFKAKQKEEEDLIVILKQESEQYLQLIKEKDQIIFKQQRELTRFENELKRNSESSLSHTCISPNEALKAFHSVYFEFKECLDKLEKEKGNLFQKEVHEEVDEGLSQYKKYYETEFIKTIENQLILIKDSFNNDLSSLKNQINQETTNNIKYSLLLK